MALLSEAAVRPNRAVIVQKALELARQQLDRLLRAPRPEDIQVAEAHVAEAEQDLADARVRQQLIENISDRRAISEEELQRRRIATKAAEARLHQARANLALLKAGTWEPEVRIARAQVALAEAEVQRVQTDLERLTITAPHPTRYWPRWRHQAGRVERAIAIPSAFTGHPTDW
jgi:HlyD family secretion protein